MAKLMALRASGRLSRTHATGPLTWNVIVSKRFMGVTCLL
jgi:hypothetical protein